MAQLHESLMGKKLLEHTLPNIARQLERIANALDKPDSENTEAIRLRERYRVLSSLDADPKSIHRLSVKVRAEMNKALEQLKRLGHG